ncbi:hypothetical protein [Novosphingobium marinum]|uniref:Uncharacterized protein n=1 Tax=Novosphingobium marinum TaxID=1514948 RepID=A0A7Y9XZ18_9SPHN|nr:hypothetical protein [Novosphingobium marinum]NYH95955.1 hypothetical protein [Novosphingobium marinum]
METLKLETTFGQHWRAHPDARPIFEKLSSDLHAAEERWQKRYCEPFWDACRRLVQTPAPTITAATFKAMLIEAEEVWNDTELKADCMEIVEADFARLRGECSKPFDPAQWLATFEGYGGGYVVAPDGALRLVHSCDSELKNEACRMRKNVSSEQLRMIERHIKRENDDGSVWDRRLATYREAAQALRLHSDEPCDFEALSAECDAYEAQTAIHADAHVEALRKLLLTPAPNLRALRTKLDLFDDLEVADGWTMAPQAAAQLARDARALIAEESSC